MKIQKILFLLGFFSFLLQSCQTPSISDLSQNDGIAKIRENFKDENWPEVISEVDAYKIRYPYSQYAVEADLLQAHSYYMSGKYFEAISAYEDFVKKNPNNENIKLAYYRIAKSYDYQASEEIDRDQSNTKKAILKYYSYLKLFPYSQPAEEVSQRVHILTRRLSESEAFVARFYFKRNLYAAALLRYEYLIKNYSEYEDLLKESLERAAFCYEKLSLFLKKNPNSDEYTQFNYLNQEDLIKKSQDLRDHLKNDSKK